ncbi:MAG: NUDIX hydrolase [Actinomycetes bacterium]
MASSPMALALSTFRRLPVPLRRVIVRTVAPTFVVGVVAVMRNEAGELLLLRERHHDGWALPGGLVSRHESTADALVRELREEIAVSLPSESLGMPLANLDPHLRRVDIIYEINAGSDVHPRPQEPEVFEAIWFPIAELPELFEPTIAVLRIAGALTDGVVG